MNILDELKKEREVLRRVIDTSIDGPKWQHESTVKQLAHILHTESLLFDAYVAHVQSIAYAKEYGELIAGG